MLPHNIENQDLLALFLESKLPFEVWAYARPTNNEGNIGSSLDLVLRTKNQKPIPSEFFTKLCDKLKESDFSLKVELRDWANLSKEIQNEIESSYVLFYDNLGIEPKIERLEEPLINPYGNTNAIQFFNSFEESENFFRLKMAKMSPEERLIKLKKIRAISGRLAPTKQNSVSNKLTIKIEMGDSK
jgi:hypothetical protein